MGSTGIAVVMVIVVMTMMVHADVKPQKDFNLQRFAGKWYRVGLAYDSPTFLQYKSLLKASMGIVTPLSNGNVNLTMWDKMPTDCVTQMYQYEATDVPGQFTYFSTRHGIMKDITVVDTNYTEYAIVLKNKVFNREYTQVALYARSLKVKNEVYQKFKAFALSRHFPRDSILTPPPADDCPASA
uniref:Lipocalin 15 n=1 Tax=Neogobius melanostomus TaxID=47308 RepID=A0A8C6SU63_9GOBI